MRWYRLSIGEYGKIKTVETEKVTMEYVDDEGKKQTITGDVFKKIVDTKRYGAVVDVGKEHITFESNKLYPRNYNPTPLNIEFEVRSYQEAGNGSTLCGIRLYNQSVTFFKTLQSLIMDDYNNGGNGIDIRLEAGYDYSNPIVTQKMRYNDLGAASSSMCIFKGQMAGITADFDGKNSHINITGALTKLDKYPLIIHIRKDEVLFKNVEGEPEFKDDKYNSSSLLQAIKLLVCENYQVIVADDLLEAKYDSITDWYCEVENFEQLAHIIQFSPRFNFNIYVDNQAGYVGIYKKAKVDKEGKTKSQIKIERSSKNALEIAKLKEKHSGSSWKNFLVPKKISASELITQPTFQGFSTTMEVAVALRPDITLGSIIELPQVIYKSGGSFGTSNQFISEQANQMQIPYSGPNQLWQVIECIHRGGFYSRSAEAWSTILLCVAYTTPDEAKEYDKLSDAEARTITENTLKRYNAFNALGVNQGFGLIGSNVLF